MRIGFLGLGTMGTPIALRLLAAGHELSVWNRSEERTKPLIPTAPLLQRPRLSKAVSRKRSIQMLF